MKKFILILMALMFLIPDAQAQVLTAKVNRDTIPEGETFMLTLELSGATTDQTPELEVLDKDFTLYSVSNSYRTNIINGNMTQSRQWNLILMPKTKGSIIIPAVRVDKYQSSPITVNVVSANANSEGAGNDEHLRFKIEGHIDNNKPYVQQQITYTLTLTDVGGLQGEEPIFLTQGRDDWIIRTLGEPQIKTKIIDGKTLREIKFLYALFPQKSGSLEIPVARFSGYYLTRKKRVDPFADLLGNDMFVSGFGLSDVFAARVPVVLTTEPIYVSVQPAAPENKGNWWLPASDVSLFAEFNPSRPVFKVGEAVSRTIYLKATGVIDAQLPEISFSEIDGIKQYPEKPETQMTEEQGRVVSLEKISNVYIPKRSGKIQLPPIEINWFNVISKKMEKAVLPPMTINVEANGEPQPQSELNVVDEKNIHPEELLKKSNSYNLPAYWGILGAFLVGLSVSGIILFIFSRNQSKKDDKPEMHSSKKYVIEQAKKGNLHGVRDGLIGWAVKHYENTEIASLKDIEDINTVSEFGCELDKLNEALYSNKNNHWDASSFIKAFEKANRFKNLRKLKNELLPKLYK